jgi:hypothetical protein
MGYSGSRAGDEAISWPVRSVVGSLPLLRTVRESWVCGGGENPRIDIVSGKSGGILTDRLFCWSALRGFFGASASFETSLSFKKMKRVVKRHYGMI